MDNAEKGKKCVKGVKNGKKVEKRWKNVRKRGKKGGKMDEKRGKRVRKGRNGEKG